MLHGYGYRQVPINSVYSVENREEAAKWLQPVRDKHVAEGWHVNPFQIGDEGYLPKYKNGDRFDIEFRRGAIVAKVAGNDLDRVKVEQTAVNPPNPMPTPDKHA